MTDPAQTQATGQVAVIPTPSCIQSRRTAGQRSAGQRTGGERGTSERENSKQEDGQRAPGQRAPVQRAEGTGGPSGRAAVRAMLDSALAGIGLSCQDGHFLSRLVHWDKRNAAAVASLLVRARQAGREEAGLTPRQREIVVAALRDAAVYRASGTAKTGCWDCEMVPGGRCASHARDDDRARAYAELAGGLSGFPTQAQLTRPRAIAGFGRRTPVAS
jgi:hypothetical protein